MNVVCDQMHQTVTIREYEILNLALYSVQYHRAQTFTKTVPSTYQEGIPANGEPDRKPDTPFGIDGKDDPGGVEKLQRTAPLNDKRLRYAGI